MIKRLRIFLSSPGDVTAAREIAALTIERLGLALAVVAVTVTAALASREVRPIETLALALGLALDRVVLFVQMLGQPFAVFVF